MKCGCRITRHQSIPSLIKCSPECQSSHRIQHMYGECILERGIRIMDILYPSPILSPNPVCSFAECVKSLVEMSHTSYSVYVLAILYMVRIASYSVYGLSSPLLPIQSPLPSDPYHQVLSCKRRVFLGCLMVASKYVNEKNLTHLSWATLSKLSIKEVGAIERQVLSRLDYRLYVPLDLYFKWHRALIRKDPGLVIKMFQSYISHGSSALDVDKPSLHVMIPSASLVA